jgi:hypothetical protein
MDNYLILYVVISGAILLLLLTKNCSNVETFVPSKVKNMELGSILVDPKGKTNDVTFNFRKTFSSKPFVKLQPLNDRNNMMGTEVFSMSIVDTTPTQCHLRIKRVDRGNFEASITNKFLIQYIAMES